MSRNETNCKQSDDRCFSRWPSLLLVLAFAAAGMVAAFVGRSSLTGQPGKSAPVAETREAASRLVADSARRQSVDRNPDEAPAVEMQDSLSAQVAAMTLDEVLRALAALHLSDGSENNHALLQRLVRRWAESDPKAASQWAAALTGPLRADALEQVAIEWANQDLSAASDWARQLPRSERDSALIAIANEAAATDSQAALRLAVELPPTKARDELISLAAGEWAGADAAAALAWARQIPDGMLRNQLTAAIAVAWSDADPQSAAKLAVTGLPADRLQADTVVSVLQRWAQQKPAEAAAWVAQFPPGDLKATAIENVAAMWGQQDSSAAEAWRDSVNAPVAAN